MKMNDRFNLPMKVDGYSVESTPMRHHTYPCEVVSDIECDSGEDARAVAHAINNHDALVEALQVLLSCIGHDKTVNMSDESLKEIELIYKNAAGES